MQLQDKPEQHPMISQDLTNIHHTSSSLNFKTANLNKLHHITNYRRKEEKQSKSGNQKGRTQENKTT